MRTWTAGFLLSSLLACSQDVAAPLQDVTGSYVAASFDSRAPNSTSVTDRGCTVTNQAASLDLTSDRTYYLSVYRAMTCPGDAGPTYPDVGSTGQFLLTRQLVVLNPYGAPGGSSITAQRHGAHILVPVPNVAGLTATTVLVEFAPGSLFMPPGRPVGPIFPPQPPSPSRSN